MVKKKLSVCVLGFCPNCRPKQNFHLNCPKMLSNTHHIFGREGVISYRVRSLEHPNSTPKFICKFVHEELHKIDKSKTNKESFDLHAREQCKFSCKELLS